MKKLLNHLYRLLGIYNLEIFLISIIITLVLLISLNTYLPIQKGIAFPKDSLKLILFFFYKNFYDEDHFNYYSLNCESIRDRFILFNVS